MWKIKSRLMGVRILARLVLMASVLFGVNILAFGGKGADPSDQVFEPNKLHELSIEIDPNILEGMRRAQIRDWREARTVVFDDVELGQVGIKIRGFQEKDRLGFYTHPNFQFDFARFRNEQRLFGIRRLVMESWSSDDNSLMAQRLGLSLFADFGLPTPRSAHARVSINGYYVGPYVIMDHIREDMISRFFSKTDGNLYKLQNTSHMGGRREFYDGFALAQENPDDPDSYMPYPFQGVSGSKPDGTDLLRVIYAVNRQTSAEVRAELSSLFDLDNLIDYLAVDMSLTDPDGLIAYTDSPPIYFQNNCYFYHDPETDQFFIIPDHDVDSAFDSYDPESGTRYLLDGWDGMRIAKWLLDQSDLMDQYFRRVRTFVDTLYRPDRLIQQIDQMAALIRPAVYEDRLKPITNQRWEDRLDRLRQYVRDREADVRKQLSGR